MTGRSPGTPDRRWRTGPRGVSWRKWHRTGRATGPGGGDDRNDGRWPIRSIRPLRRIGSPVAPAGVALRPLCRSRPPRALLRGGALLPAVDQAIPVDGRRGRCPTRRRPSPPRPTRRPCPRSRHTGPRRAGALETTTGGTRRRRSRPCALRMPSATAQPRPSPMPLRWVASPSTREENGSAQPLVPATAASWTTSSPTFRPRRPLPLLRAFATGWGGSGARSLPRSRRWRCSRPS